MIDWIMFGSILLILILILIISVSVTAVFDSKPEVTVKLLCFTIVKIPADPRTLKKKKLKAERKQAKKAKKEAKKAAEFAKKQAKLNRRNSPAQSAPQTTPQTTKEDIAPVVQETAEPEKAEASEPSDPKALKKAEKERAKAKKEAKKAEKAAKKAAKANKPKIDFEMIMDYVRSASPPIKRLFKKIRIRDVYIDWVVGSDEAGKTAIKYGGLCTAFYSLEKFLTTYFDAKIGEINIEADFQALKDDIFIYLKLKLRIGTALGCVLWLGFRALKTFLKYNKKNSAPQQHKGKKAVHKKAA